MGNVSSRTEEPGSLYLKDQNRCELIPPFLCAKHNLLHILTGALVAIVTISNLSITNSRQKVLLNVAPSSFPTTRVIPKRDAGDDTPVEFVQVGSHVFISWGALLYSQYI